MCGGGFLDDAFDFIGDIAGGIGKTLGGALTGDFGSLMNIAALIPGPQQPFLMGANALSKLADDDPLGALFSAAGAAGSGGLFGQGANAAGTASEGINAASSFGGIGDMLGNVDNLSGVWDTVGAGGDALGDFITTLPSGRLAGSGIAGGATGAGNVADRLGMGGLYDMFNSGGTLFGGVSDVTQGPLMRSLGGLAKLYGGYQDYRAAQDAREAYADNVAELRTLYGPNSPYAQQARKRIERRDAARGRNSQYGPRETELAALLADKQASVLSSPGYASMLGASRMKNAGLGGLIGGGLNFFNDLRGFF